MIAGALAVWSGFTALCGTATGFWQLFLYRLGVGVGEAGGVAPSYALIADYFPPQRRARALGIFSLGVPIGLGAGTLLGAYIAALIDWRAAFLIMGVAGITLLRCCAGSARCPEGSRVINRDDLADGVFSPCWHESRPSG